MKKILLTQGKFALVDDDMYDYLNQWKWYADTIGKYPGVARKKSINGKMKSIKMSRFVVNAKSGYDVDHINHDRFDNRKSNLRICTRAQNLWNQRPRKNTSSKYKGVSFHKGAGKWQSIICKHYKYHYLGYFNTELEASKAYQAKAKELFGDYRYKNAF